MTATANAFAVLEDDSSDDESDDDPPPEVLAVGAGALARNVRNPSELKPLKYKQAMKTEDMEHWLKASDEEYQRFKKREVFEVVQEKNIPPGSRVMTTTWNCKKKVNGVFRARLNIRGYEQVPGEHYDEDWTSAPVANDVMIRIMLVLMLMSGMYAHLVDVQGAFLLGTFENAEKIYCHVPEGWEDYFESRVVLLLLKTVYGLKQAANCFYNLLVRTMRALQFERSVAESAMY